MYLLTEILNDLNVCRLINVVILKFPSKTRADCFNEKRNIFTIIFIDFSGRES